MAKLTLRSPLDGWSAPLEEVPDPAFAERMLGDGLAIDPTNATLHAPCDGEIIAIAAAHHALTVRATAGIEILLHVGLDTVKQGGRGFELRVREGARVSAGQPLLDFDLDALARAAPSLLSPVIVMEGAGIALVGRQLDRALRVGDLLMEVEAGGAAPATATIRAGTDVSRRFVVRLEHGIHARPAARLAESIRTFSADVELRVRDRKANARSGVSLMGLGIQHGDEVTLTAAGRDAAAAAAAFETALAGLRGLRQAEAASPPPRRLEAKPAPVTGSGADRHAIRAVVASRGIAVGKAAQLKRAEPAVEEAGAGVSHETAELARARAAVKTRVERLAAASRGAMREVLEAHLAFIDDAALVEGAEASIARGKSAGFAWRQAIDESVAELRRAEDPRLRERIDDLRDLAAQVLQELAGEAASYALPRRAIVIADELLPSQFAAIAGADIAGVCLAGGGPTSHVAILAAASGVPMLVAAGTGILAIAEGTQLVLDADRGVLLLAPDASQVAAAEASLEARSHARAADLAAARRECVTADGVRIEVFANVGSLVEAREAVSLGAEGCGLLRTEFLFLDRDSAPDESFQAAEYQRIAEAFAGRPVVLRTLDAGGDKPIRYLPMPREDNPALGLRGVRTSLLRPELLRTQLRAMASVSPPGQCRILLPMVTGAEEIRAVRDLLDDVCRELGRDAGMPLGIMIETPAAALTADRLAAEADFLSIGTNDLTQYTLAMDRGHPDLAARLDGLHPAALKLIAAAAEAARRRNRSVSVCGGLASDPAAAPILIGLGVVGLSVVPSVIPQLKSVIRRLTLESCHALARRALELDSAASVRQLTAQAVG